jgi:hypothetical protein
MSDIFPKWTNRLPLYLVAAAILFGGGALAGFWYFFTPKYTRVGYQPLQPVAFSHATHSGQLGMDCRICHQGAEASWFSNFPTAASCMNCHNQVLKGDPRMALVSQSALTGKAIPWVQIHKLPDYVYFNHAAHLNRGVGCASCHGQVQTMEEVAQIQPLSMTFCLDCHRNPGPNLRPLGKITDMTWSPASLPTGWAEKFMAEAKINPLQDCSACHR